jgi:hypothetical protein
MGSEDVRRGGSAVRVERGDGSDVTVDDADRAAATLNADSFHDRT